MTRSVQNKRVMLVDDDEITNLINTAVLTRTYDKDDVIAYTRGEEALTYLKQLVQFSIEKIPGVIFLDINMPSMDGWEFLDEFQKLPGEPLKKCKIFILSSSIDLEDVEKSKEYPVVQDFISKPLTLTKLKTIMGKF
jgi:CheY-like chemotaxis protein